MKNRRGISAVVANVLIILLVLAAIAIIWTFIRPLITNTSEQITAECLTLELEVTECAGHIPALTGQNTVVMNATVSRDAGKGNLRDIRFIFGFDNGETSVVEGDASDLDELGTKKFSFTLTSPTGQLAENVEVTPVVGVDTVCPLKNIKYNC